MTLSLNAEMEKEKAARERAAAALEEACEGEDLDAIDAALATASEAGVAEDALAREVPVREGRVEDVHAALEALRDRRPVQQVLDAPGPTAAHAERQRREGQVVGPAEVAGPIFEARGETLGSLRRGPTGNRVRNLLLSHPALRLPSLGAAGKTRGAVRIPLQAHPGSTLRTKSVP